MPDDVKVLDYVPDKEVAGDEDNRDQSLEWVLSDPVRPEPTSHEGEGAAAENGGGASSREGQEATARNNSGQAVDASGSTEDARGLLV